MPFQSCNAQPKNLACAKEIPDWDVTNIENLNLDRNSKIITEKEKSDLSCDSHLPSKTSILSQYPHELVTKYNKKWNKHKNFNKSKAFICRFNFTSDKSQSPKYCNKEFSKSWNLIYHARIHIQEKPFKCTECRESFAQKGNLKRHLKIHSETALTKRKRFQCVSWLKLYTTKFNLKVHRQTKHNDTSESHLCDVSNSFSSSD
jgi:hypothetical protein